MCTVAPNQRQAGTERGDVAACVCQSQREIVKYSEALSTAAEEQFFHRTDVLRRDGQPDI